MKCLNCGKEFTRRNKKGNRHIKYCSVECYWKHHLRDVLKGGKDGKEVE